MKSTLLIVTLAFSMLAFGQAGKVQLKIKNAPSKELWIAYYLGNKQYIMGKDLPDGNVENIVVKLNEQGEGVFEDEDMKKGVYMIVFQPENQFIEYLYEDRPISLEFDFKDPTMTMNTDSKANEVFFGYQAFVKSLRMRMNELEVKASQDPTINMETENAKLQAEYESYLAKMDVTYPTSIATQLLKMNNEPVVPSSITDQYQAFYYYRKHFFDKIDFSQEWIIRTPIFESKIDDYFSRMVVQHPDSISKAWDGILNTPKMNKEVYKFLLVKAVNTFATSKIMGMDAVYVHLVDSYYATGKADWIDSEQKERMITSANNLRPILIGKKAPNFEYVGATGTTNLYATSAENTVLFFTASDCDQCKFVEKDWLEMQTKLPANTQLIEVRENGYREKEAVAARRKTVNWEVTYPTEASYDKMKSDYNLDRLPSIIVLDKDKKIIAKKVNPGQVVEILGE